MGIAWDLRNGPVPLVVLIEHLAKAGWSWNSYLKDNVDRHTLDTPRVMCLSGSTAKDKTHEAQCRGWGTFAPWRWHTLAAVTARLCRLEGAVRAAMGALRNSAELGSRDSTHAQAVWQAGQR